MNIRPEQIDPDAAKIVERLRRNDHAAFVVGGCVRDLLLGLKPKDFDIATSATPPELRRLFRNCRIIGRRFRLAHIFFGNKIIETATFRANPREGEDDNGSADASPDTENNDLLIRRDNVFGTAEEDARRRDFTINGLFYDIETGQVIDHVNGMVDLEARLVRTIGDPDIRFREDPIRILRAVKFAARCSLTIEPETYRRMIEHSGEIAKCAQARVSEEFFRLLRSGAAKRSMELLIETALLGLMVPELSAALTTAPETDDEDVKRRKARFWAYLAALDQSTTKRGTPPSNALVLATLLLPPLRDALHPDTNSIRDIGQTVTQAIAPLLERLKASRRDGELARQILLATRYIFPSSNANRKRPRLAGREFLDDALRLHEIVSEADAQDAELMGRPLLAEGDAQVAATDDENAPELDPLDDGDRGRRRRRGGRGRDREQGRPPLPGAGAGPTAAPHAPPPGSRPWSPPARLPSAGTRTAIPDLPSFANAAPHTPSFLGTGVFGGRWGALGD